MVTLKQAYRLSASFNDLTNFGSTNRFVKFYELLLIVEYSPYNRFD